MVHLNPNKRILFLTKDPELIRKQLRGELNLKMEDLSVSDLLDDVNTDAMTPAWACFNHRPEDLAVHAYAGLIADGKRLFEDRALLDGNFEVIVSGERKGTGSSRETAVQAEKWSGIRIAIAASFAPIHARNNINQGVLMADHSVLKRLTSGEAVPLESFTKGYDPITRLIVEYGGLFPFYAALANGEVKLPPLSTEARPMTMAEKVIARHLLPGQGKGFVRPHDAVLLRVDGGYSHEFTTAQVHHFLLEEKGENYSVKNPDKFAVFEDHLIYADGVAKMAPFAAKIQTLRDLQREFQAHTGVRDYSATDGRSPGICHQVAREEFVDPGDFIQATDSHTCMGGGNNAFTFGVGATEYAALIESGFTFISVPESIRFVLKGSLNEGVTAKDVILWILLKFARVGMTLDRVMEFGGPGLKNLDMDERATLANMATECSARSGICEADERTVEWLLPRRKGATKQSIMAKSVAPDANAEYAGGVHEIDLSTIEPMVATPGDAERGIPSDPTNGALISSLGEVAIDIAYGGSCTAGKETDLDFYARVLAEADQAGLKVSDRVQFFIQFGSEAVEAYSKSKGYIELFDRMGVRVIGSGCGACIGCGPGVSTTDSQVTVSAINRNFRGRSGPGQLYLASPLTVATSAILGHIAAFRPGMFLAPVPS
jgi:3-isopropylmalate/(R)-2-methylmalate dehydratase large subunit